MLETNCYLTNFQSIRPQFQSTQQQCLDWLVAAHTKAEEIKFKKSSEASELFRNQIKERLWHVGCKPDTIATRGHAISDFLHEDWEKMLIYRLQDFPEGVGLRHRAKVYDDIVSPIIEKFYPNGSLPPQDLIHVSCTGYSGPSSIQKMISKRNLGKNCTVTHAYHMGCYGSFPALRMAKGFMTSHERKVDIIHTELCTLHNNPSLHTDDQLVAHSLFADGFIRYSAVSKEAIASSSKPSLHISTIYEEIIPNSLEAMRWTLSDWGFDFSLSREIPVLIRRALKTYLSALCSRACLNEQDLLDHAIFAIHPGGPRILKYIQKEFGLMDEQVHFSRQILHEHGNMSSATLPHIWEKMCCSTEVAHGTKIISLAFGPGLTIAGAIMEKCH